LQFIEHYITDQILNTINKYTFDSKDIYQTIQKHDGGYTDFPEKLRKLYQKIDQCIEAEIDNYIIKYWREDKLFPRAKVKLILQEKLADVWVTVCNEQVEQFLELSEEQQEEYIKKNENLINVEEFFVRLRFVCQDIMGDLFDIRFNWKEINEGIREKFVLYWGVSDAYYKVK
jgi:hypothetical protein